jgi:hypothetical protein
MLWGLIIFGPFKMTFNNTYIIPFTVAHAAITSTTTIITTR